MKKNQIKNEKNFINLNINKDDTQINDFLFCWSVFNSRPNRLTIFNTYNSVDFYQYIDSISLEKTIHTEVIPAEQESIINDQIFAKIDENVFISFLILDRNHHNSFINEINFFYKTSDDYNNVLSFIEKLDTFIINYESDDTNKLNTLCISQNNIEIEAISPQDIDIENIEFFYHHKTFDKVEKMVKSLRKSKRGLSILYGKRGTGKTSIINYLSSKLDRIVIFIPNNLVELTFNNPEFRKFLKKHHQPILIIDDCETLFNEFFAKSNVFVNNLLQLVEGFLSENIETTVISIFNVDDEDEIDHSLLECNTLIDKIKFDLMNSDESTELSKHLLFNKKYKDKNRLIDILKKKETKVFDRIGF